MVTETVTERNFIDDGQRLIKNETNNNKNNTKNMKENRFEMLRKRYFSEIPLAKNPLSKMKKNLALNRKKASGASNQQPLSVNENITKRRTVTFDSAIVDEKIYNTKRHTIAFDTIPQVEQNEMRYEESLADSAFDDNFCDTDERAELFANENENIYGKRVTLSKAADFVRRRTNFLRKTHIKAFKNKYSDKQQQQQQHQQKEQNNDDALESNTENEYKFQKSKLSFQNSKNTYESPKDGKRTQGLNTTMIRSKRLIWKNARKRVRYVVRLIRREPKHGEEYFGETEEEDEVLLIEENKDGDFLAPHASPYRFRSRSLNSCPVVTSPFSDDEDEDEEENEKVTFTALNIKYLSPKGRKLDRFTDIISRSSTRGSRKGSVDSGTNNPFLSEKYLDKSKSLDSMKAITTTTTENNDTDDFEQLYLSTIDVSYHSNADDNVALHCIQNNLYLNDDEDELEESGSSRIRRQLFEVTDEDIDDIIADEVNSYMSVDQEHRNLQKRRRASEIFHFSDNENDPTTNSRSSNIKHALSYSVNDLYDLFNKDRSVTYETSFDDLMI